MMAVTAVNLITPAVPMLCVLGEKGFSAEGSNM
jgi:hypothetical protein